MEETLVEIRCPLTKEYEVKRVVLHGDGTYEKVKTGERRNKICNTLSLRVVPGSKGEAYCTRCKRSFDFEVTG